ncbi:Phosphinothricin N-acetyltransferase [compost metagenome]
MSDAIRPATRSDAAAICAIYNHYVLNTVISFETEAVTVDAMTVRIDETLTQFPWLVYEADGRILGYAYASKWKVRKAYLHTVEGSVYLAQDSAGRGVGTRLYQALISELSRQSVHAVLGGIVLPNPGSVALHEKLGFVKVAHFPQIGRKFDQWLDVGYWQLIL